jgi:hypothetical protein
MILSKTMIGGAQGLASGFGSGVFTSSILGSLLSKYMMRDFDRKYKDIPQDKEEFIRYLREKAAAEKEVAKKTRWLNLIPAASSIWGAISGGMQANKAEKAAILSDIAKATPK